MRFRDRLVRALREPLVQFALIGLVLFGLDRATEPAAVDPRQIRVDRAVYADLAGVFFREKNRLPTAEEMDQLVDVHLMNETLYREARGLELDHGDQMMRERLVQRMRLLIYNAVALTPPDDDALRAWFEENRERFVVPPRIGFRVIGLDAAEAEARGIAEALETNAQQAKSRALLSRAITFRNRPRPQMVSLFNEEFIAAIEALPQDRWQAVPSPQGWQVARLMNTAPGREPDFDELRTTVLGEWREAARHVEARASLDALMSSYPVARDPYDPGSIAGLVERAAAEEATR
ncbi:MAG: peptidylprolyl isomerase [Pseudomonadota bacterium]